MTNDKFLDIVITDFALHTQKMRKPSTFGRAVSKSITSDHLGRSYGSINDIKFHETSGKMTLTIPLGPEISQAAEKAKKLGRTLRILMPNGTPVVFGKDVLEGLKKITK